MKLKCMRHGKRVMVIEVPNALLGEGYGEVRTLHREDGSRCKAVSLKIGNVVFTPDQVYKGPLSAERIAGVRG